MPFRARSSILSITILADTGDPIDVPKICWYATDIASLVTLALHSGECGQTHPLHSQLSTTDIKGNFTGTLFNINCAIYIIALSKSIYCHQ